MNRTTIEDQQRNMEAEERAAKRGAWRSRRAGESEGQGGMDLDRLREVGENLRSQIGEQTRKRPYVALGAAAGVGFVAGSLFGSRLGQVLLAAGLGYLAKNVLDGDIGVGRLEENIQKLANERSKG